MASFSYQAIDKDGRKVKGVKQADSAKQLRQNLKQEGLMPVDVRENKISENSRNGGLSGSGLVLSSSQLAMLTRQLSVLLDSGMSLIEALEALSQQADGKRMKTLLGVLKSGVSEGNSFADCLAQFPRTFDQLYISSIRAAEQSGTLDRILDQLADHTESEREFRQKTILALIYPILVAVISLLIVVGLMVYIVPQVVGVFEESGQTLPVLTRGLISISEFLQQWGLLMLLVLLATLAGARIAIQNSQVRYRFDQFLISMPLLGRYLRGIQSARYAQTLGMLSESGVALSSGLPIAEEVVENAFFKRSLKNVSKRVIDGESLSICLGQTKLFPMLMVHMLASGEASGNLDQMLKKSARQQQNDLAALVSTGIALFEPLMLLVMGAVVLLIVLAILVPILSMNQLIS
ncbi:type II secretion system inner membrane protein GspF [Pseudoteredinibacter isoporae]|uniref:General secretion pathway protein F n=1 Tax=Pseudoteredinibacter isoporae TaxID=570281 RepID=A0A7X0JTA7_9GAMM|nr:type II secretion system inner membrane protein GspF [Pseudoteredinibacter isoporae]MBB6521870.1 general secretion pathway protein F [Pseudoteredinibacter isoporae]NHO87414.1 type II secretion system inner membrane protein GspF [Pseudoteredinibacter isoporae]NIB24255.1 type II secretion system inner membrane protein GspF [Pseudoteredinibacter isoporae]